MAAKVTLKVHRVPDGSVAGYAKVVAHNRNAADIRVADWSGTCGPDGTHTWQTLDTGLAGDFYDFDAEFIDDNGVRWTGRISERIGSGRDQSLVVYVRPEFVGKLEIDERAVRFLKSTPEGEGVLSTLFELQTAATAGMVRATVTLATAVIEGLIRIRAKAEKVWKPEWENSQYGVLVETAEIRKLLPANVVDRARGLADLRRPGAHEKGTTTLPAEAQIAKKAVEDLVAAWCK